MSHPARAPRRPSLALALALLIAAPLGCGREEMPAEQATQIPVHNPEPDYELKDVNLDNESQFEEQIGGIPNY